MIFVDTGAWYALAVPSDADHFRAKSIFEATAQELVTTDYVVDELLTLFAVRNRKWRGVKWQREVLDSTAATLVKVTEEDFAAALALYNRYSDKAWSFTDCTSYVVMQRLGVSLAFSFDQHFRQFGTVTVVPE